MAEQRAEFHNLGDPITPPAETYAKLTERFRNKILRNIRGKAFLTRKLDMLANSVLAALAITNYARPERATRFRATISLDASIPVERARRIILAAP